MDADSSYGGSDTAQDSHSGHDNSSSLDTTQNDVTTTAHDTNIHQEEPNNFYHKNEITLPVNYDETDFQENKSPKQPHYLSTANLNINETLEHHSNLEEMSKNYKSTSYLNESPRIRKKSDVGVDNPAFQEEEYKTKVKSTFDNNKPYNGDLNSSAMLGLTSPNKNEETLTEAVNLELINLKPVGKDVTGPYENGTNGMTSIPVKKDNDAEIGNPYDEYFVPVNEHRKYMSKTRKGRNSVTFAEMIATSGVDNVTGLSITAPEQGVVEYPDWLTSLENTRGEKLYVTMDKRNKKKRNKCLCWGLCLCIVAAAVIIGILAAVGVIGNQGPPVQEVSARQFGSSVKDETPIKTGGIFGLPRDINNETTTLPETQTQRFTPEPPVVTVSSMLPSTETSMIQVPRALESQLVIDNIEFTPELANKNSTEFKHLAESLETELKHSLFSSDILNFGASDIEVKVMDFASGSVVVKYRITWVFKDGIHNAKDPINEDMFKKKLQNIMDANNGFMNTYHIDGNKITVDRILDMCKIDNNGCEYNCSFDYKSANFICSCPDNKYLAQDGKACLEYSLNESEIPDVFEEEHHVQTTIIPHVHPEHEPAPEPEPTAEPEPSAEPEPASEPEPVAKHEPTSAPEPEPSVAPESESTALPEPKPTTAPESSSEPKHENEGQYFHHDHIETTSEPSAEPVPISNTEHILSSEEEIHPESTHKPEMSHENYVHFQEIPIAHTTPEPSPEPTTQPNFHNIESKTTKPVMEHEHLYQYDKATDAEPTPEPTTIEHTTLRTIMQHEKVESEMSEHNVVPLSEPVAEPTSEPVAEPTSEPIAEPTSEPIAEPTSEPIAEPTSEPVAEPTSEPVAEPTAEPVAEPTSVPVAEPTSEPVAEPTSEPVAEPPSELTTETSSQPTIKPVMQQTFEPIIEPTAEPAAEPTSKSAAESTSRLKDEHTTEVSAAPTPEPIADHDTTFTEISSKPVVEHNTDITVEHATENKIESTEGPATGHHSNQNIENAILHSTLSQESTESSHIHDEMKTEKVTDIPSIPVNVVNLEITEEPVMHVTSFNESTNETQFINEIAPKPTGESNETGLGTSTESTTKTIATVSSTTSDNEYRHNHLSDEIFAESETTTISSNHEITHSNVNEVNTERNMKESKESSTNINSLHSEITTIPTVVDNDHDIQTIKTELTTQQPLQDTSIHKQSHEENLLIPVSVNEAPRLLHIDNDTEEEFNHTPSVPIIVNNQTVTIQEGNNEQVINMMEPKIVEITTLSPTINVISEHSTEGIFNSPINNTDMHATIAESTENTSAMDNMSPFLPEIDNDTFVNKLHLGEHVIPHIQNETHDEETEFSPPRLDNDQMNTTNPQEQNPIDNSLQVVPLEGNENEILDKVVATTTPKTENDTKQTETHEIPVIIQEVPTTVAPNTLDVNINATEAHIQNDEQEIQTTTNGSPSINEQNKLTETNNETVLTQVLSENKTLEITTKSPTEPVPTTLLPEIINNVHSNSFFEGSGANHLASEDSKNSSEQAQENSSNAVSASTEDLIALETTTNIGRAAESRNVAIDITTESSKNNQTAATVHAEVLETVTESVHFESGNTSINNATETTTSINSTQDVTTVPNLMEFSPESTHQYEVNEEVVDVTTTEKLFIPIKPTTENSIVTQTDFGDLSVVPLDDEDKEIPKRVPHDTGESLEADPIDTFNDISEEEQIINDKFHHQINDVDSTPVETSSDSTTSKESIDNNSELRKFDESKLNKKSYYDKEKPKFEKKVKLEKVITTVSDDEVLTTAVPTDKQTHPYSDIRPVTEDFSISGFRRCTYGQFNCINGTSIKDGSYCIPENDRCDSVNDCSDGSDEIDCVKNGCPNNYQCASGQCLKRHLVCDGIQNCNDGSDEVGCDEWTCRFDEFSCGRGSRCLPIIWKCDGRAHCPDGSDEHNCPSSTCDEESFHCSEQNTCIPKTWRCDGKSDCMNAEDETSCECANDEFKCAIGGGCIKKNLTCDGIEHCADKSDEWNCLRMDNEADNKKYLEVRVANTSWVPICSDNWNQTYSDLICQNLGYSGSAQTENIGTTGSYKEYFKLKDHLTYGAPILSELERIEKCDSLVSVSCQEFTCGSHSTLDVQSARIIGGNRGVETQWPSLTLLYNKKRNVQCTATLITPLWIIASHSCIFDTHTRTLPNEWTLYAGSTNFFSNPDNSTTQVRQIKRIIPHPQAKFSVFELKNDVVLVELTTPLTMTRNVSAMCLPEKDIEPRQLCVIAGWGISKPGEPNKNLHYLPVPIIDTDDCNSTKHYNGLLNKDKICAGYTDSEKSPCYNDEGAPLMCFSDSSGTWELQGVLSHHDNCARSKHPAIYNAINERMRTWIMNTIGHKPSRSA